TDANGEYRLANIPAGTVQVRATYIGLEDKTETVNVASGQSVLRDFELDRSAADKETVQLDKITVVADRVITARALAMNEQRQAPNSKYVVAFDEYLTGFDDTLQYFLRFIPGGAGTSIRGLPGDMGSVLIDGTTLAGAGTRATSLLLVPLNNVSRIEVTKVPTPDMPAILGGSINVISKSGFELKKPQLTYNLYSSYYADYGTNLDRQPAWIPGLGTRHILPSLTLNYSHPFNDRFAMTANFALNDTYRQQVGTISTWDLVKLYMTNINSTWTPVHLTTKSARVGFDWKISPKDILSASAQFRHRDSIQYERGLRVDSGGGATGDEHTITGSPSGNGAITQTSSDLRIVGNSSLYMAKYEHRGDIWRINASASESVTRSQNGNIDNGYFYNMSVNRSQLRIDAAGINTAGDVVEKTRPQSYTVVDRAGVTVDPRDGNMLTLNNVNSNFSYARGKKSEYKFDIGRDFDTSFPLSVKLGAMVQPFKNVATNIGTTTWDFRPGLSATDRMAGKYGLVDATLTAQGPNWAGAPVGWVSPVLTYNLYKEHPEYFVKNEAGSYTNQVNGARILEETISAGYARLDARLFKNKLWLVGGVRYEKTADEGWGPLNDPTAQYLKDASGKVIRNSSGQPTLITTDPLGRAQLRYTELGTHVKRSYSGYYPSLSATYNIRDDLVLRAGYAKTVGRPAINNIIPSVSIPDATGTGGNITVTNTALNPWSAISYDLALESYQLKDITASVSVFRKEFSDFFVSTVTPATPELLEFYGVTGGDAAGIYNIVTLQNGGDAVMQGVELSYKHNLTFLPNWARGFQVFANWTRRYVTGKNTGDFSGFFPSNISWGVNFTRPRFGAQFSSTYRAELRGNPVAAGATIPANTFDWSRASLSYQASVQYSITKHIELYAVILDFNNKFNLIGLRRHNPDTPDYASDRQTLKTGPKVTIGIRGEF
ncbi:MAG: TonB-dependent receptor, partial [Opitutae bacterium]|nr:TonB-dependent receptor [Opitutae bacterium]